MWIYGYVLICVNRCMCIYICTHRATLFEKAEVVQMLVQLWIDMRQWERASTCSAELWSRQCGESQIHHDTTAFDPKNPLEHVPHQTSEAFIWLKSQDTNYCRHCCTHVYLYIRIYIRIQNTSHKKPIVAPFLCWWVVPVYHFSIQFTCFHPWASPGDCHQNGGQSQVPHCGTALRRSYRVAQQSEGGVDWEADFANGVAAKVSSNQICFTMSWV